jgi:uncharacterized membrane protein YhaH (DUF805 family)
MGPLTAVATAAVGTFTFKGRASRSEYWWTYLFCSIAGLGCLALDAVRVVDVVEAQGQEGLATLDLFGFVTVWAWLLTRPTLTSLSVRRLRDAGFSGFWLVLYVIPPGALALLVLHALPSAPDAVTPGDAVQSGRRGTRPVPQDTHQRAMQGYALLFEKDKKVTPAQQAARKAEISDYYRSKVLKSAPSA